MSRFFFIRHQKHYLKSFSQAISLIYFKHANTNPKSSRAKNREVLMLKIFLSQKININIILISIFAAWKKSFHVHNNHLQ